VTEIYLLDEKRVLRGAISLARLVMAQPETRLAVLAEARIHSCPIALHQNELAELFDSTTSTHCPSSIPGPHGWRCPSRPRHQLPARKSIVGL